MLNNASVMTYGHSPPCSGVSRAWVDVQLDPCHRSDQCVSSIISVSSQQRAQDTPERPDCLDTAAMTPTWSVTGIALKYLA